MADVNDAGTAEVSVSIKTLIVGNKRMSLGIYRQLRCAPLIQADGTLAGTPWGAVNAHPGAHQCHTGSIDGGRNVDNGQWWHVVWERDGLIFRDHVTKGVRFDEFDPGNAGERYMNALILRYLIEDATRAQAVQGDGSPLPSAPWNQGDKARERSKWDRKVLEHVANEDGDGGPMRTKIDELEIVLYASQFAYEAWDTKSRLELARKVHGVSATSERISQVLESSPPDTTELLSRLRQEVAREKARREAVQAARRAVADLPQLFISG